MSTQLDHLVIVAADLNSGVEYVAENLGVSIPKGGEHPAMGTHNHLMQLGSGAYLEVIAINPQGSPPSTPRWYDMDNPLLRYRLKHGPFLAHWVVNVADYADLPGFGTELWGKPRPMSRGDLRWLISVPEDGRLPGGGLLPTVIQWQNEHPASNMHDSGCRLLEMELRHPQPGWLLQKLNGIQAEHISNIPVRVTTDPVAGFSVRIRTPSGESRLDSF